MAQIEIDQFICRSDNFAVLVHDSETGATVSIDAPDGKAIEARLKEHGWSLTHVLVTHHHGDHTDGLARLKMAFTPHITGPRDEAERISHLDETMAGGETKEVGPFTVEAIDSPGHTAGAISYHFVREKLLFAGDTLFSLGCGRLFEKGPAEMWGSLERLAALPDETQLFCGHEYTSANAAFALTVDPANDDLKTRAAEVDKLRAQDRMTLPSSIGLEKRTNPFLRVADPDIRKHLSMESASDVEVFAEIRRRKDQA